MLRMVFLFKSKCVASKSASQNGRFHNLNCRHGTGCCICRSLENDRSRMVFGTTIAYRGRQSVQGHCVGHGDQGLCGGRPHHTFHRRRVSICLCTGARFVLHVAPGYCLETTLEGRFSQSWNVRVVSTKFV